MVPELAVYGGRDEGNVVVVVEPFDGEFKCSSCMNLYWIRIV